MRHGNDVRQQAIELYRSGIVRRAIAVRLGISLSTIKFWTRKVYSRRLSFNKCAGCGKTHRRRNIRRRYCSESCKNGANYCRRRLAGKVGALPPSDRNCIHCGAVYLPSHGNAKKYCSKRCRQQASLSRRHVRHEQSRRERVQRALRRRVFDQYIETLLEARQNRGDLRIDPVEYRTELDFVSEYYRAHKRSLTEPELYDVQGIFDSATVR